MGWIYDLFITHLNLIVLPDGHGPHTVLGPELLGEGGGHEAPPDVGGGREMPLPGLGPVRGDVLIQFHLLKFSHHHKITENYIKIEDYTSTIQIQIQCLCSMWCLSGMVW